MPIVGRAQMTSPLNIGIIEDDPHMREYLSMLITGADDMALAYACGTLQEGLQACAEIQANLCLVDIQLPDGTGIEFIEKIRSTSETKALILTVLGDKESVLLAFKSGASGYLLKDSEPEQILNHIRSTLKGGSPISAQAATHLLGLFQEPIKMEGEAQMDILTKREKMVLTMFSRGLSYKETASILEISPNTVSSYVKSIYSKLEVNSRNEAIFEALQHGWIDM